jgi:ketosteroid isomerase-like protein
MLVSRITRAIYERGFGHLERGDLDALLRMFDDRCRMRFVGDTPLGVEAMTAADIRQWFERFRRLVPNPRFEIQRTVVAGPPWRLQLAAHVLIRSTIAGEPYENQFAHFLTLRWGKVIDDLVLEDTQRWERACQRLLAAGVEEAGAPALTGTAAS